MDKLIFTALNSVSAAQEDSTIRSNNLANASVPGFRRDIEPKSIGTSFLNTMDQYQTRNFAIREGRNRFSADQGIVNFTGELTDVAIEGKGYFIIQPQNADRALSRRGDFKVDADGLLRDGAGALILSSDMAPIEVPPHRKITINQSGLIIVEPFDGEPFETQVIGTIATAEVEHNEIIKHKDGQIRLLDGTVPVPDNASKIAQGYLESSNVNTVEELVESLNRQRGYELNIKMITMAKELDEATTSLMRLPN